MATDTGVPVAQWDAIYQALETAPRYPHDAVIRWSVKQFGRRPKPGTRMLDVGAGTGRHAIFFAQRGFEVTATDYSPLAMEAAQLWAKDEGLGIRTIHSGAEKLPLPDDTFDGLLCYGVLCYLTPDYIEQAVSEMHRVLKPGGQALIITRNTGDSRFTKAKEKDGETAIVPDGDDVPWKVEAGMWMSYLSRESVPQLFGQFARVELERMTFTQGAGRYVNDDWLIFATK